MIHEEGDIVDEELCEHKWLPFIHWTKAFQGPHREFYCSKCNEHKVVAIVPPPDYDTRMFK